MDDTRLRAIIREEIALAVKTLAGEMYCSDPDSDGYSFEQAASSFDSYAYRGAYEAADEGRAQDAANPFEETKPADPVTAAVRAEVVRALEALGASARYQDMPTETGEIALRAVAYSADGAVSEYEARCETADGESKTAE